MPLMASGSDAKLLKLVLSERLEERVRAREMGERMAADRADKPSGESSEVERLMVGVVPPGARREEASGCGRRGVGAVGRCAIFLGEDETELFREDWLSADRSKERKLVEEPKGSATGLLLDGEGVPV